MKCIIMDKDNDEIFFSWFLILLKNKWQRVNCGKSFCDQNEWRFLFCFVKVHCTLITQSNLWMFCLSFCRLFAYVNAMVILWRWRYAEQMFSDADDLVLKAYRICLRCLIQKSSDRALCVEEFVEIETCCCEERKIVCNQSYRHQNLRKLNFLYKIYLFFLKTC